MINDIRSLESIHDSRSFWFSPFIVTIPTKQEGEECGSCFSPDTDYFCGSCGQGLECLKSSASKLLPDTPSRCKKKPGKIVWPITNLFHRVVHNHMNRFL